MIRRITFIAILILVASFSLPNLMAQAAHEVEDISIDYDDPTKVEADQVVHLPGSEEMIEGSGDSGQNGYGYVTMPADLPENTELTVSQLDHVKEVTDSNGEQITRCGEAYSFTVKTPEDISYSKDFSITLPYCNGLGDLDIYALDESTDNWTGQNAEKNESFPDYTAEVQNLNKIGIFSAEKIEADETMIPLGGDAAEVNANQKVLIENTNSWIVMPSGLPQGTTIKVEDATGDGFVTGADGLEVAGDVLTVTVTSPEDTSFEKAFTLVLSSSDDSGEIYYYNEEKETWKKQDAKLNDAKTNLTMETNHFSTYGVFTEIDDNKEGVKEKETENNDNVCYDEAGHPADMYITINFDDEVNVCPDQQIQIDDTLNLIVMPQDLPKDSKLTVTDVGESDIVTNAKGLHRGGDVLQFTLKTPEGSEFTGNFSLKMSYANGVSIDDIYYYNESSKKWDSQGATFDYEDFTLNVELSHLSTYGVFGIDEEEEIVVVEDEDDPDTTEVTVEDGDDDEEGVGGILPSTATSLFNWILIGAVLVAIGFTLFMINRRKSSKQG